MVELLGLDKKDMRFGAFDATYEEYYGVPKKDLNDNTPSLTFANIENEVAPTKNHDLLIKMAELHRRPNLRKVRPNPVKSIASTKSTKAGSSRKSRKSRKKSKSKRRSRK